MEENKAIKGSKVCEEGVDRGGRKGVDWNFK